VARHRQDDGDSSRSESTQILPVTKRRLTASPLLLAAGGIALALVIGVGGWALLGDPAGGDPLVYPWTSKHPGDIDVSVSMVPTDEPTPSEDPSVSPSPQEPRVKPSTASQILLSPEPVSSPSRSQGSLTSAVTASVAGYSGTNSTITVSIKLRNPGAGPVDWRVDLTFNKDVQSDVPWNAKVQVVDSRHLRFTSVRALGPGEEVTFGFIASFNSHNQPKMMACTVDGRTFSCST
jgi:Cellulose binding domain